MSMLGDGSGQGSTAVNDNGTQESSLSEENENQPVGTESSQEGSQGELSNPFLANVDEADRPIVDKYIKQWDAGVTRRFQDIRNQYRPYEQLGDVETLQQAVQLMTIFEQNPEAVYQMLAEKFGQQPTNRSGFQQQPGGQNLPTNGFDPNNLPEELAPFAPLFQGYEQKISAFDQRFGKLENALNQIGQYVLGQVNTSKQSEEDKQVEQYMGLLKQEFGDFDEDYVLTKMLNGMTGEDAVKAYKQAIQQQVNQSRKPDPSVPAVLSGGGSVAAETVDVAKLDKKQTVDLVADVLRRAQEQ